MSRRIAALLIVVPALAAAQKPTITSIDYPSSPKTGETVFITAKASAQAPAGGLIVQYTSSEPNFFGPGRSTALDTIPEGQAASSLKLTLPRTNSDRTFKLSATANGITISRNATIVGPRITSITIPDSVIAGRVGYITATLDAPTSDGLPAVFAFSSPALRLDGVTQGSSERNPLSVLYRIEGSAVENSTPVSVTHTANGVTRTLKTVVLPAVGVDVLSASPMQVRIGGEFVLTAHITRAVPNSATVLALSATGLPTGMTIPASMTVPAGATSGHLSITAAGSLTANTAATFKVRLGTTEATVQVPIIVR